MTKQPYKYWDTGKTIKCQFYVKFEVVLPAELHAILVDKSSSLKYTPSYMIALALIRELGLVGFPLDDSQTWGVVKKVKNNP